MCTSSPADLLTVKAGKIDPDATEILDGKDDVAVIELNKPCPGDISVPTSQKKMPHQDTGSQKRHGIKPIVYTEEEDDSEEKPAPRPAKVWRKDPKDLRVVDITPSNYVDATCQQCYINDMPHVIQACKGYMDDYPERFYTGPGTSAELRDANENSMEDVSAFLKDFLKRQEIEGLHFLQTNSPDSEIQRLIAIAHADFPHAKFPRVITDTSEGVDGRKDCTGLLGNLHTRKALTRKSVTQVPEDKVERTFCPWCVKASGTAGPLFMHIMEHYRLVLGCSQCYRECFESSLTFRSHYWSCKGVTSSQ